MHASEHTVASVPNSAPAVPVIRTKGLVRIEPTYQTPRPRIPVLRAKMVRQVESRPILPRKIVLPPLTANIVYTFFACLRDKYTMEDNSGAAVEILDPSDDEGDAGAATSSSSSASAKVGSKRNERFSQPAQRLRRRVARTTPRQSSNGVRRLRSVSSASARKLHRWSCATHTLS